MKLTCVEAANCLYIKHLLDFIFFFWLRIKKKKKKKLNYSSVASQPEGSGLEQAWTQFQLLSAWILLAQKTDEWMIDDISLLYLPDINNDNIL